MENCQPNTKIVCVSSINFVIIFQTFLSIYPQVKVTADRDRAHAYLNGADYIAVAETLKQVFGIQNFSPVYKVEKSVEVLKSAVQEIMKETYRKG